MRSSKAVLAVAFCLFAWQLPGAAQEASLDTAKSAYEKGDYQKAIEILKSSAAKEPANGEIELLLAKAYLESNQYNNAVSSAEKAVAIDTIPHTTISTPSQRRAPIRANTVFAGN